MTQPSPQGASGGSAAVVDELAIDLVALYAAAEQQLLADETRLAQSALSTAAARVPLLTRMRNVAQDIASRLRLRAQPIAWQMAQAASDAGARLALVEVLASAPGRVELVPHGQASAAAIALDLADKLQAIDRRMLRFADDAYRAITADAATALVQSQLTPHQAQAQAWRRLTERGVIGFTDRRGRQWNLATYVEMAVRTAGQRAFNASHLARLTSLGVTTFTINHDGHPCPICLPFEGRVLGLEDGQGVYVTVQAATVAGLFHPNCRHVLVPYFAGVTNLGRKSEWTPADEQRYRATQRLRQLEREVRAAKYQQAAALTPLDAKRAGRRIAALQAAIRTHVDQNDLVRRRNREQLDLGNR